MGRTPTAAFVDQKQNNKNNKQKELNHNRDPLPTKNCITISNGFCVKFVLVVTFIKAGYDWLEN